MDSEGHLRDEFDRIIKLEKFKTSKYNSVQSERQKFQALFRLAAQAGKKSNVIFDNSIQGIGKASRQKKKQHALHFFQKSTYISKYERELLNKNKFLLEGGGGGDQFQ